MQIIKLFSKINEYKIKNLLYIFNFPGQRPPVECSDQRI
jgi:hypothetical protein